MTALALILAQVAAPPPAAAPEEDVVVIARKLDSWRGTITTNPFGTRCTTKKSTGDREIDAIGCEALHRCWPATVTKMRAASTKGVAAADRDRLRAEANAEFGACVKPLRATLVADLRARRAATGGAR